jgi:hypothetical protein
MAAIHGPFYTWGAILLCIEHDEKFPKFPTWVIEYLGQCANRMIWDHTDKKAKRYAHPLPKRARSAGKAKRTIDLRDRFSKILGFPKQKHGPGSPLDPWQTLKAVKKSVFALRFGELLLKEGRTPVQARRDASLETFRKVMDERTLRQYLLEEFDEPRLPTTKQEWVPVIARYVKDVEAGMPRTFKDVIAGIDKAESRGTVS